LETDEIEVTATQAKTTEHEVAEVVVTKKGQTTIPVKLRRKYKIEEGTKLSVIDTEEGILLKPKKTFWDMLGAYSKFGTPEEVKKDLDKLRYEDEDE
jgi:AbrB family looped-hinge helix DNA binding protein